MSSELRANSVNSFSEFGDKFNKVQIYVNSTALNKLSYGYY